MNTENHNSDQKEEMFEKGSVATQAYYKKFVRRLIYFTIFCVVYDFLSLFLAGFHLWGLILLLVKFILFFVCIAVLIMCIRYNVTLFGFRGPIRKFALIWISCFVIMVLRPLIILDPAYLGARCALWRTSPEKVVQEARGLMPQEEYHEHGLYPKHGLEDNAPEISKLSPIYVFVYLDSVHIKKMGIMEVWTGYIIYPEGVTGEGRKICEGLYWRDK